MNKKIKIFSGLTFLIGISAICFGINLMVKSDFGVSVVSSIPYVYSLKFRNITFGGWSYLIQIIPFILMIISFKDLKVKYFLSFFMAYVLGKFIDIFGMILPSFNSGTLVSRVTFFVTGTVLIAFGISAWIKSQYLMQPCDVFIKDFSKKQQVSIGKTKTFFDLSCLTTSVVSSFLFLGKIEGVYLGTLLSALTTGMMVKFFMDLQNKYIEDVNILNKEKIDIIMEYDFFQRKQQLKKEYSA
ncbi:DUF6198 family protein [uncultured Ilyobacter sp.]|uniref:YczE/YyaS/YitT family protein n=1 Tax=uncultured Ilyobacter sp. TaxID=544433 RepID=UPI0029C7A4E2|nr:DUF6198 family protein [uncultured Ilyobacter sp.]